MNRKAPALFSKFESEQVSHACAMCQY